MKKCCHCKIEKLETEFYKNKNSKDGLKAECKECHNRHYYLNREKDLARSKNYRKNNKGKLKQYFKEHYQKNKKRIKERTRNYAIENKEKSNFYKRKWKINNKNKTNESAKKYRQNIQIKIADSLRGHLRRAIKKFRFNKNKHTFEYLGCNFDFFIKYIESKFIEGMSWDNYGKGDGKWVIDHILPLCSVDLTKDENINKIFNYTNLRPLFYIENSNKSKEDKKLSIRNK